MGDGVVELKDDAATIAKKAADAAGGGAAFKAELKSDKILPETRKQKDKAFGEAYTLTTYGSDDCGGKPIASKTIRGCKGSPSLKECPKDMWTKAYTCKKTEKPDDMVYSENWSWGVYKGQFLMRYESGGNTWKHLEPGKMAYDDTCYQWLDDVQHVFLQAHQQLWAKGEARGVLEEWCLPWDIWFVQACESTKSACCKACSQKEEIQ